MATSAQLLAEALAARETLAEARAEARRQGWRANWWEGRQDGERHCGLENQGATCYLNSLLQALFAAREVRAAVYAFEYDAAKHGQSRDCVPLQIQRLFARMQCSGARVLSTTELTASFGWSAADSFRQHDIQELCRVLFDALGKFGVPLGRLFEGLTVRARVCRTCGHRWGSSEPWYDVCLDVESCDSLEAALRQLVAWETLEGENTVLCDACGVKRRVSLAEHFEATPRLLMIQLKRFVFDLTTLSRRKLNHRVAFPASLSLDPYGAQPLEAEGSQPLEEGLGSAEGGGRVSDPGSQGVGGRVLGEYRCVGVLVHSGSAHGGHYFALLRDGATGEEGPRDCVGAEECDLDGVWFEFNDATVRRARPGLLRESQGSGAGESGASGYLLLYERLGAGAPEPNEALPPASVLCEVEAEEAAAAELRRCAAAAAALVEVTLVLASDLRRQPSLVLHADALLSELVTRAAEEAGEGGASDFLACNELRLRRWNTADPARGGSPEQPVARSVAKLPTTLHEAGLAERATLLVEWRPRDAPWPLPATLDLYLRTRRWATEERGPPSLLCVADGLAEGARVSLLLEAVASASGVPPALQRLVLTRPAGDVLVTEGLSVGLLAVLELRAHDELLLEAAPSAEAPSALLAALEAARHRLTISYNDPRPPPAEGLETFSEGLTLQADARETVSQLTQRIGAALGLEVPIRLRRSARGAHITGDGSTPIGAGGVGLCDGSAVHVELGAPLREGELLVRVVWATEAVSEDPGERLKGLATRVGAPACELVVPGSASVAQLKRAVATAAPPALHTRLRLFKRCGARVGALLADARPLRLALAGGFDDKEVAAQRLTHDEALGDDGLLLRWRQLLPREATEARAELAATVGRANGEDPGEPKPGAVLSAEGTLLASGRWSGAELAAALASASGIPLDRLALAKPPSVRQVTAQAARALAWNEPKLLAATRISAVPVRAAHGELFFVRDSQHAELAATEEKRGAGRGRGGKGLTRPEERVAATSRREAAMRIRTVFDD